MTPVIETHRLSKRFGTTAALDGLDFQVDQGEVHGYLGPNGAGKSTTIRILLGLYRRTSGEAKLFGQDPWGAAATLHRRLAYVPGDVTLWPNLSGGETIDLLVRMRHGGDLPPGYKDSRARLVQQFDFDPRKKGRSYSKGNRQKVALIAAFALPAELYIFDEPTSGLDPLMEQVFHREVARVKGEGSTVLLSSHILSEVEALYDRISIVRSGKIVESGTLASLRHLTRTSISFRHDEARDADLRELSASVHDLSVDNDQVRFSVDSDRVYEVLPRLAALQVSGLVVSPPTLEELFLRQYGDAVGTADRR